MEVEKVGGAWLAVGAVLLLALMALGLLVPDDGSTALPATNATTTESRSGVLSGNQAEVLSRNQINVLSDVNNCYGDGSCQTTIISTTTDAPVIVNGDHSGVGVLRLCVDRDGNGYQTNQPCGVGYTPVQP